MNTKKCNGFSLVELLISIFVVAIGILGTLSMQLTALRTTQDSSYHTMAIQLASEIASQIRAHKLNGLSKNGADPYQNIAYKSESGPAQASASCMDEKEGCTSSELVQFNISEWEARIKEDFPSGRIEVCRDAQPWNSGANTYKWGCGGAQSELTQLVIKIGWKQKKEMNSTSADDHEKINPLVVIGVGV